MKSQSYNYLVCVDKLVNECLNALESDCLTFWILGLSNLFKSQNVADS